MTGDSSVRSIGDEDGFDVVIVFGVGGVSQLMALVDFSAFGGGLLSNISYIAFTLLR